jgi:hypothetical protein
LPANVRNAHTWAACHSLHQWAMGFYSKLINLNFHFDLLAIDHFHLGANVLHQFNFQIHV